MRSVERGGQRRCLFSKSIYSKASLEFIRGIEETSVPDVRLTRSLDGSNGTAFFRFETPSILSVSDEMGDITGA